MVAFSGTTQGMNHLRLACLIALITTPVACGSPAMEAADAFAGADTSVALDALEGDAAAPSDAGRDAALESDAGSDAPPSTDAGSDAPSSSDAGLVLASGHLRGRVVEALTLDSVPVANAVLRASNGVSVTTGADGTFDLVGIPAGARIAIEVTPPRGALTYSSTQLLINMPARGDVRAMARLLRGCSTVVNLAGGERTRPLGACGSRGALVGVELPMGGVVNAAGAPVARVRMEIATIPALAGGELIGEAFLAFPGDMSARDAAGMDAWLESRGAAEVRLFDDATGEPAQLASGREATLTLPASPSSVEDRALRVWSYSESARAWVEEGRGELAVDAASGLLITRMTVPHFSWWNSDQPATRTCLTGRIAVTGGVSLGATSMMTTGVDYLGSSAASIAADGTFQVFARANSITDLTLHSELGRGLFQSARISTGARDVCTDVGTITVDSTRILGCTRGRVEDAAGVAIANADITATQLGRTIQGRSGSDGSFCIPLVGGARAVVRAESTDASGAPLRGVVYEALAAPGNACGGTCTDLGAITLRAASCIVGTLSDFGGPAARAWVHASGRAGSGSATTRADGTFCATVPAGESYRVYGYVNEAGGSSADIETVIVPASAGSCGAPSTCTRVTMTTADLACVHGVARDALGAPVAGATVRARPERSTRYASTITAADGSFCVPARAGERASIEIVKETRTTRDYEAFTADVATGAAMCGGAGCSEVGPRILRRETFATCIRGRILDRGAPVRTPIEAYTVDQVAILRPREDGRFCIEADPGVSARITLRDPNTTGCARDRETALMAPPVAAPSCIDEERCVDVGTLDFADFCAAS